MTDTVPHDLEAEQAVLGECMRIENGNGVTTVAAILTPDDWYRPLHADLWQLLLELNTEGMPTDPVIVRDEAPKHGIKVEATYLHTLYASAAGFGLDYHARIIADCATRRRIVQAGQRMIQRAENRDLDTAELVQWAGDQVAAAADQQPGVDRLTLPYDDFMDRIPEQRRMIVPSLLGVGDRLVMTGEGGAGKSTVLQQIAVCAAAGIPPLDWHADDTYQPATVSIYDLENSPDQLKTRLWPLVKECRALGADPRPNLTIGGDGNPLDVLQPHNALSLLRTIEHDQPDLVYIGPVYKMHNDDPDKEAVVKKITKVLDAIRQTGAAIITEAHHTKEGRNGGSLQPSGSNLWNWWPEFGLGMRLVQSPEAAMRRSSLERWRVDRVQAQWPHEIEATGKLGLAWARADGPALRRTA